MAVSNGNRGGVTRNTAATSPAWRRAKWLTNQNPAPPSLPSGDFLLVHIAIPQNKSIQYVKHGTDNLTRFNSSPKWISSAGIRHEFWFKDSSDAATPLSGVQNIEVQFNSSIFNGFRITAMCFSGASGIGTQYYFGNNGRTHTRTMSVSEGSQVYGTGTSTGAFTKMVMNGVDRLPATLQPNQANIIKIIVGALTTSAVSAGTIDVTAQANVGGVTTNAAIEILASGGGGSTRRRIQIV